MGSEIDTKSIEPVRSTAVSLFGDKGDHKRYQSTSSKSDCEKEVEELRNELANCKVQLEAKHGAHMQALLKQEQNQKMIQELSTLLKNSDIERNKYMNECSEGRIYKDELEFKMKEVEKLNLEIAKVQDQLSHVLSELKSTKKELLKKDAEIVAARDSELKALTHVEILETALKIEMSGLNIANESLRNELKAIKEKYIEAQIEMKGLNTANESLRNELKAIKEGDIEAQTEMNGLNIANESLKSELKAIKDRDIETQVEIALLKSQIQEQRFAYKNECDNNDIQTEKANQVENQFEISFMKKELENASAKIAEYRTRAEQAISRAEVAENNKAALEERIRRHKEQRMRRKAAITALKEESTPKPFSPSTSHGTPGSYQPLGKVLNMRL